MSRRGRERDVGKERYWRDVILRWQRSDQTIRAFCDDRGLSEQSFHAWRRTIAERDQAAGTPVAEGVDRLPVFVPLRVTPPLPTATPLEVVVGQGRVVRVSPGFDATTLRSLLTILEEAPSC